MSWYWWVLAVIIAYGLGLLGSLYFQKTHPPDRRTGERRQADRRVVDARHARPPTGGSSAG